MSLTEFDFITGLVFLSAIIFGALFGFWKVLYLVFAVYSVNIIVFVLVLAHFDFSQLIPQNPMLLLILPVVRFGIPLLLIGWIIADLPGAASARWRVYGILFALAWATVEVSTGALAATLTSPRMKTEIVEKSLTGPALLAVGNAWSSLAPVLDYLKTASGQQHQ